MLTISRTNLIRLGLTASVLLLALLPYLSLAVSAASACGGGGNQCGGG